jgi:hypothetical protein
MPLIVVCGLKREAALIAKAHPGLRISVGGGDSARLERELDEHARRHGAPILSTGLAGALHASLRVGDIVVDGHDALVERLHAFLPHAIVGAVTGQDRIAATVGDKRALLRRTGAIAVDMESHVAARVAARHELPFAAIRIISDTAGEALPPAALIGMAPDGGMALGAVLMSLARRPAQLPALIRTGRNAGIAFRELARVYDMLGRAGILGLDLGQLALDMG